MSNDNQFEALCTICGKDVYLDVDDSNPDRANNVKFENDIAVISSKEEYYYAINTDTDNMLQDLAKENNNSASEKDKAYICTECVNDMLEEKRILKCNSDIDTNDTIQKTELCAICGKVHVPVNKIEWYYDTPIIQGIFGSVTLDMCIAIPNTKNLSLKWGEYLDNKNDYICDCCVSKLLRNKELTIIKDNIVDNEDSIFYLLEKNTPPEVASSLNNKINTSDLYKTIRKHCIALKYNDGVDRILDIIRSYPPLSKYNIICTLDNTIWIIDKTENNVMSAIHKNEVLVIYAEGEDFEIMSEEKFRKRFKPSFNYPKVGY